MLHVMNAENVKVFATAGNAIITLESGSTGTRYTYKIRGKKNAKGNYTFWFVSLMVGSNNDSDYSYLGYFKDDYKLAFSDKSCRKPNDKASLAFSYFMSHIDDIPEKLHIYHSCKCGRCGRTLTTPESIERGLGPDCAGLIY